MSRTPRGPYPQAVPDWMIDLSSARVLDLGSGLGAFAAMIARGGHQLVCLDRDELRLAALSRRLPSALPIAAQAEALPFTDATFDRVTAAQTLHNFAPGLALPEIARVLRPGGQLAVAYNTRDDTVPWVKKLIAMMQRADPDSMRNDYGTDSVDAISASPYFTEPERRDFRNWVPITRDGLLTMVGRRPATRRLDDDAREDLLAEVGGLYDSYARAPEPLMLPFRASVWRATVDHSQLTLSDRDDDVLQIPVGF